MTGTATILALCWAVFVIYWGVTALNVKRTIARRADWLRVAIAIVVALGVALLRSAQAARSIHSCCRAVCRCASLPICWRSRALRFWCGPEPSSAATGAAPVTLKENHELIQHGPYAYVRHPIYSGLLLLSLATAVHYATLGGFVLLVLAAIGFAFKMRQEEFS